MFVTAGIEKGRGEERKRDAAAYGTTADALMGVHILWGNQWHKARTINWTSRTDAEKRSLLPVYRGRH